MSKLLGAAKALAERGKDCETAVMKALKRWQEQDPKHREFNRLLDTRAAQRIVKPAPADFDFYGNGMFGLIECKQTKHPYRLSKGNVSQLPRMLKRYLAGGACGIVVYHSEERVYRGLSMAFLQGDSDKGSWDLRAVPAVATASEALAQINVIFKG